MFYEGQQVRVVRVEDRVRDNPDIPGRAARIEERLRSYIGQTGKVSQAVQVPARDFFLVEVIFPDGKQANIFRSSELEPVNQGEP